MTGSIPVSMILLLWCVSNAVCDERTESVGDVAAVAPPVIPVGLDAYRLWGRWPYQRLGVRAYMKGAYDRTGGNDDRSNYIYQDSAEFNVTLDEYGPGAVYFVRYHFWHGSPWHYEVDGVDHVFSETTTPTAAQAHLDTLGLMQTKAEFVPRKLFPKPLAWTYPDSKGADLIWVPIEFRERFRMAFGRTYYGTGYYIFHRYMADAVLSRPLEAWDGRTPPDPAVLDLLRRAGTDIAPLPGTAEGEALGVWARNGSLTMRPGESIRVTRLAEEPTMLRAIKFSVQESQAIAFGKATLRITWDDRALPSVETPVALFFGTGTLHNREGKEYLVKALPVSVRFTGGRVELSCYLPMPFFGSADIELTAPPDAGLEDVRWSVRGHAFTDPPEHVGYLHATYQDHGIPVAGEDLVFLDTDKVEGGGPWSGSFIGTSFIFTDNAVLTTLEGDPRFFFDDALSPQGYGTGTEEWGTGGWYWMGGENSTLPLGGHPVGVRSPDQAQSDDDLIHSAYRFLLADLMPFGRRAVIRFEHGGHNESLEHYRSVTYWYGAPAASLVLSDTLEVGDAASEASHQYLSPDASPPTPVTSRYEWGVDHEVFDSMMMPLEDPADVAEFSFTAAADETYFVWVRGRTPGGGQFNSSWFQFDEMIGTRTSGSGYQGPWSLQSDWSWARSVPPADAINTVSFKSTGPHNLRIQGRLGSHDIDRIWLSTTQTSLPGDASMPVPKTAGEIVLDADDITRIGGAFALIEDRTLPAGRFLRVGLGPTQYGEEFFPAHTQTGRTTRSYSEFTVSLRPDNLGVLLRRTLDYAYPNQRARVLVAGVEGHANWADAGTWYLAGSNTFYHSLRPGTSPSGSGELGAPVPIMVTSNRRFREDEFLIPRRLTRGLDKIRLRLEFLPVEKPLLPGRDVAELAWSEIRYQVYSYVMPRVGLAGDAQESGAVNGLGTE